MSDTPTFGGTITGGIQDISALLPLLGTDQCEKHVGSALDGGFLYSAVTPLSIFGSLGIVRASVSILVASLNIPRFQFLGAKLLHHSGFSLSGAVAPMIALDPKHPDRFLAETKLEAMLAEENIDNVPDLTVSWPKGTLQWNFMLVASTLIVSSAGLVPYISLIIDSGDTRPRSFFPLGFGFPVLRIFGSALCVIIAQFLIQLRILILMKARLLFISITRLAKEDNLEDLSLQINTGLKREKADNGWTTELAAEKSLWALQNWLSTIQDMEGGDSYRQIRDLYNSGYVQHFGAVNTLTSSWITVLLCIGLGIGCISTIIGYIGCFFLVQESTSSKAPLLWLVLEAVLSVLRIFVWAVNPSWDDSKGVKFELQLCTSPSLLTCHETMENMLKEQYPVWLPESGANLEQIVAYAGPRPTFSVQGVEFFYVVAINSQNNPSKRLLLVISTEKQQRSRILFKEDIHDPFSIYRCTLLPLTGSSLIQLTVYEQTQRTGTVLTMHSAFMAELGAHYDKINSYLQNQESTAGQPAIFGKTWDMQRLLNQNTDNPQQLMKAAQISPPILTEGEKACLDYNDMQHQWRILHIEMDRWVDNQIAVYKQRLTQVARSAMLPMTDQPAIQSEVVLLSKQCEAIEQAHLLAECQRHFEWFLVCVHAKWVNDFTPQHAKMVEINLQSFADKTSMSSRGDSGTRERYGNSIHKHKLEGKFLMERDYFFKDDAMGRMNVAFERLNVTRRLVLPGVRPVNKGEVQILHRLDTLHDELIRYYASPIPIWHANLTDVFKLPFPIAASFHDATSVSEQCGVLLQLQKNTFVQEMEYRFSEYPLNLDGEAQVMLDQVKARCRMRAHQLFAMLMSSHTIDFQGTIDSPGLPTFSQLTDILKKVAQQWNEKVRQNEEALASMSAESEREHVAQTRVTPGQLEHLPISRNNFEAAAHSSSNNLAAGVQNLQNPL